MALDARRARELAHEDASKIIEVAREEPSDFEREAVFHLPDSAFEAIGGPMDSGPHTVARRVASDWEYVDKRSGVYVGPSGSVETRFMSATEIEPEGEDEAWQAYWDTLFVHLAEAEVWMCKTYYDTAEHDQIESLWVVDRRRFTVPGTGLRGHPAGDAGPFQVIYEPDVHKTFGVEKPSLGARARSVFQRK